MAWHGPDDRRIYYEDTGRGDTVVVMPGWGGSVTDLNALRRELADGFRVIAVDLPGSGRSQPQPRRYSPTYYLDDAQLLLAMLEDLGVASAHLVGFSDGGEVALLMAALAPSRAPSVPSVLSVLTWGAAGRIAAEPRMLHALEHLLDTPLDPLGPPDPLDELKPLAAYLVEKYGLAEARIMTATWARAMAAVIAAGGDVSRSRAAAIACPTLLIAGSHDPFCPPDLVRAMADAVPGAAYAEADGGHDLHLSHGRWLASTVVEWLGGH